ncbi:hypothetical protein LWI28_001155 [Acer negundo]|uniref:Uncharacterized protein n=1 Tax=Acer negundo TaxID=4023 RepID=A0AAD5ILA5_ACENE|nr:hypothetical protein LWI28_001155 [Acer negundo]
MTCLLKTLFSLFSFHFRFRLCYIENSAIQLRQRSNKSKLLLCLDFHYTTLNWASFSLNCRSSLPHKQTNSSSSSSSSSSSQETRINSLQNPPPVLSRRLFLPSFCYFILGFFDWRQYRVGSSTKGLFMKSLGNGWK